MIVPVWGVAAVSAQETEIGPCGVGTVPLADDTTDAPGFTENVEKPGPVGCTPSTRVDRK